MKNSCQSCSMTIESGDYCEHCLGDDGNLRAFDEIVARFGQWTTRQHPDLAPDEVRRRTLEFMSTMPAWRDHPELKDARS